VVHDPLDSVALTKLGLVDVVDAETGRCRLVDGATIAPRRSLEERVRLLRRKGARVVSISTEQDPFASLHGHFAREGHRR
jgi:hypothetical protein